MLVPFLRTFASKFTIWFAMEKRKVILVGTAYPFRGGIAAFNERLASCFQKQGYEVEIWTFTVQYPNFLFPGKTQLSTEPEPQGLAIQRVLNSVNPFNWIKVGALCKQR